MGQRYFRNERDRRVYKVRLEDLQQYFYHNIFYFEDYDDSKDYDEELIRQYEEQGTDFLRRIGAMVSVDTFFEIIGDKIVYVREVPPGVTPVKA